MPPLILPFNMKFGMPMQTDMPVTTARQNRNRKYNLNMWRLFVFAKREVVIKTKFHYAIWSQTGPKLVAGLQRAGIWPIIYISLAAS